MVSHIVLEKLEAGYSKLQASTSSQCRSLLKQCLTREIFDELKRCETAAGATLLDVLRSGLENLDSTVGLYAPDAEAYAIFASLFDPVLYNYHLGFELKMRHPCLEFGDPSTFANMDPDGQFIISTRIRCARNIQGFPFSPRLTKSQYLTIECLVSRILVEFEGNLAGEYHSLASMSDETQQRLTKDHILFAPGDRFLKSANACRYWPSGRGLFFNTAKTFIVWIGEEDELRVISLEKGGDLRSVYTRLISGMERLGSRLMFVHDQRLGFLSCCPSNAGTGLRASVLIKLPVLGSNPAQLKKFAFQHYLQVRGTNGEHSESVDDVFDISNMRRLGLTEYQAVMELQRGVLELIREETAARSQLDSISK